MQIELVDNGKMDDLSKRLAGLGGGLATATKNAVGRAASKLRSSAFDEISKKYDISKKNLRLDQNVFITYEYGEGVQASVVFRGHLIPLYRFGSSSPVVPQQDKSRKIKAFVDGSWITTFPSVPAAGHQKRDTAPSTFRNAFVAEMRSGHVGIFERTGESTPAGGSKIRELMGSSIPQMLEDEDVQLKLAGIVKEKFDERLDHEVERLMNGW